MKSYFSYPFNDDVRKTLIAYYDSSSLEQHSTHQDRKTALKLKRILAGIEIDFNAEDVVLDIGCARGILLTILSDRILRGIGLDISQTVLDLAVANNVKPNLTFSLYNGTELGLCDEIDKVTLLDVLEHAFDPDILIENVREALRQEGHLIVEVPFSGWLSEIVYGEYHQGHLRYYDPKYLQNYLERFGFEVVYAKTYNSVPFSKFWLRIPWVWSVLNKAVNWVSPRYYPYFGSIIMVAKRL